MLDHRALHHVFTTYQPALHHPFAQRTPVYCRVVSLCINAYGGFRAFV
jgi:hypothetical protein